MRFFITILFALIVKATLAQTLGGSSAYNFLRLSPSPIITAAGGINISDQGIDASPSFTNPALLKPVMHAQLNLNFSSLSGGVKGYNLIQVYHHNKTNTTFNAGLFYINYGTIQQTDAAGNVFGTFTASDYVIQLSASRQYLEKWRYGFTSKLIHSSYSQYKSIAVAADVGVLYADSSQKLSISIVARNIGIPIKSYAGQGEELPFDLQLGLTKKLQKAPFGFSITAQHLHQFNLHYRDTTFDRANNLDNKTAFLNKLFDHFVFAGHIYIGDNLEGIIGFNQLRRTELSLGTGNGVSGFSAGFASRFKKIHINFAHAVYQKGVSYNQLGLALYINGLVGLGKQF